MNYSDPMRRPIRVVLYTTVPAAVEAQPIRRAPLAYIRNRIRRGLEGLRWALWRDWRGQSFTYDDTRNSNRGDFAVRLSARRQLLRAFGPIPIIIDEVAWGDLGRVKEPDLILLCGGGCFLLDQGGILSPRFLADLVSLQTFQCPIAGASLGLDFSLEDAREPHIDPLQSVVISQFVERLSLFSVRDTITQAALKPFVAGTPEITADPTFFFRDVRVLPEAGSPGLSRVTGRPLEIGLNLAFHDRVTSRLQQRTLPIMVSALKTLAGRLPCRFTYFAHTDSEQAMAAALQQAGIDCGVIRGSVDALVSAYAGLDLHIGQMMHSSALAAGLGVPVMILAVDGNAVGFSHLVGLQRYCLNMWTASAEQIVATAVDLVEKRHDKSAHLMERRQGLEIDSMNFYERVALAAVSHARTSSVCR